MTLRTKTLVIISVIAAGAGVLAYAASSIVLQRRFAAIERQYTHRGVSRALYALSHEVEQLNVTAGDWATRDGAYAFIHDGNPRYIRNNLADEALSNIGVHLVLYVHSTGRIVFGKSLDPETGESRQIPRSLIELVSRDSPLVQHADASHSLAGLLMIDGAPILITSRPILSGRRDVPIPGALVMGRRLGSAEIKHLSDVTDLSVAVRRLDDPETPADFKSALATLSETSPISISPLSDESIAGYALLKDIYGKPVLILRIERTRPVYSQARGAMRYIALWALLVGLVFAGVTALILEKMILSRLTRLSSAVKGIGRRSDLSVRVPMPGTDELSSLAAAINGMLDGLHKTHDELEMRVGERTAELAQANQALQEEIAERKRAEEELLTTKERLQHLLSANPAVIYSCRVSAAWGTTFVSENVKEQFGHEPSEFMDDPMFWDRHIHPDDAQRIIKGLPAIFENDYRVDEYRFMHKDGTCSWIRDQVKLIRDADGRPVEIIGCWVDISKRKRAEEALRESEARFRAIGESIPYGVWICSPDGKVIYVNDSFLDLIGMTLAEVKVSGWTSKLPGEDLERTFADWVRCIETGSFWDYEHRILGVDGSYHAVLCRGVPVRDEDGRITSWAGIHLDITERKRAEEELLRTREQLQHVLSASPTVIYSFDMDCTVFVSRNVTAQFGYKPEDFQEDPQFWTERVHPEDGPQLFARLSDVFERDYDTYEYRFRHKDGTYRWIRDEVRLVRNEDGTPLEVVGCWIDITERKRAEQELAQAQEEAERRAAELESFISSTVDGVSLLNAQGNLVWINDAGRAILGADPDDSFVNWETRWQRYSLNGELLEVEQYPVVRALRGESMRDVRYKVVAPSGKEIILSVSASPVRDSEGRIVGATSVFRDASETVALERHRTELYEREHHIADVLQRALIPQVSLDVPGYRIAADYKPALREAEVGGDFYDVFELSDGRVALVMGDVSGKGLPAAVHTAMAKYMLRAYAHEDPEPGHVLERLNRVMCDCTPDEVFITVFYGILDPGTRILTYANGGHDEPLLQSRSLGGSIALDVTGRAIGAFPGSCYSQRTLELAPGDVLLIYTDGVTDARSEGRFFGRDGLSEVLAANAEGSEEFIVGAVLAAASDVAAGQLHDDAAVVVVKARMDEGHADSIS